MNKTSCEAVMKTKILVIAFLLLSASYIAEAKPGPDIDVNFGFFYNSLSPFGSWLEIDAGIYGWHPNRISRDWRPYSDGRWTWTENGWYWDSYEPFGWATYHYGRWINDEYYGWIWVPDYEWGPSWVEWRYDDDYIGWAPLPPYAGFRIGFGIHFSIGWHSHFSHWNFVRFDHFCHNRVHNYFVDSYRVNRFFSNTKYRTNYYDRDNRIINGGVDRDFIERRSGERIRETSIRSTSDMRDISRNSASRDSYVRVYRPSDDDLRKTRDVEIRNINRPERSISIQKDKIAIRTSRDNGVITRRDTDNSTDRNVTRSERTERTSNTSGRAVARNESENRNREIERTRENAATNRERNERTVERKEISIPERNAVRENNTRSESSAPRSEMYRNRSESRTEKSVERTPSRESRSSESRVESRSSNRSSEKSAPPSRSSNSGSRERKR